jgi:acetyltransferase
MNRVQIEINIGPGQPLGLAYAHSRFGEYGKHIPMPAGCRCQNQNEQATLVDGTPITLRPIKPENEPLWHELLAGTSRESLWARFQFAFKTDIHEAAIRFCFVDYDRELTVVAEANIAGARRLLGVARAVNDVNCGRAEFGILVGDPWQGKGLGNLLTGYCSKNVDRTQVREIYAVTGRTNTRMIGVFRRFGFDIGPADDPALLLATKSIACDLR